MPSIKHQSAIESNNAFMVKIEDLVREIVIQNSVPYYRIESSMELHTQPEGDDIYLPVIRIITYFEDTVNQISDIVREEFDVAIEKSIDKRKARLESFSYKHVQYIAGLKENRRELTEYKRTGSKKFEIQVCSMLQDAWSGIEKELGYDSANFPDDAKRDFYRVGALLEMADIEFCKIRSQLARLSENLPGRPFQNEVRIVNEANEIAVNANAHMQPESLQEVTPEIANETLNNINDTPVMYGEIYSSGADDEANIENEAPENHEVLASEPDYQAEPEPVYEAPVFNPPVMAEPEAPVVLYTTGYAQTIVPKRAIPAKNIIGLAPQRIKIPDEPAPVPVLIPIFRVKTPEPAPQVKAPAPQVKAPEPTPEVKAPQPAPQVKTPEPAPQVKAPEPAPQVKVPEPAPQIKTPEPVIQAKAPEPAGNSIESIDMMADSIKSSAININSVDNKNISDDSLNRFVNLGNQAAQSAHPTVRLENIPEPPKVPVAEAPPPFDPFVTTPLIAPDPFISSAAPVEPAPQPDPIALNIDNVHNFNMTVNSIVEKTTEIIREPAKPIEPLVEKAEEKVVPFFEDEMDKPVKVNLLDENAPMTDASLREYVLNSKLIKEVDQKIAERAGAKINADIDVEGDVERLRFLKVFTLKQLYDRITDNKNDIVAFAEKWIGKDNGGSFDSGISLFYLEYLLVGKKNDPAFSIEYVVKFISDNDYSARYIIPTYNSIRNTEVSNFAHLTLKA